MADHYETIGVDRDADDAGIRTAYEARSFELSRRHRHRGPGERGALDAAIVELDTAFRVLGDEGERRNYDALLADRSLADDDQASSTRASEPPMAHGWRPPPSLTDERGKPRRAFGAAGMGRWWLPLLIPAAFLILTSVGAATSQTRVVHGALGGAIFSSLVVVLLVVWPTFAAGVRYHRSHSS